MRTRKIGTVAREIDLSERRVREYERAGLVRPRREAKTGDRVFTEQDVAQLRIIKALIHNDGLTIDAVKQLLRYAPCWELLNCERKESCPAFLNPTKPCYELRAEGVEMPFCVDCTRCPVCGTKNAPRTQIVVRPSGE